MPHYARVRGQFVTKNTKRTNSGKNRTKKLYDQLHWRTLEKHSGWKFRTFAVKTRNGDFCLVSMQENSLMLHRPPKNRTIKRRKRWFQNHSQRLARWLDWKTQFEISIHRISETFWSLRKPSAKHPVEKTSTKDTNEEECVIRSLFDIFTLHCEHGRTLDGRKKNQSTDQSKNNQFNK